MLVSMRLAKSRPPPFVAQYKGAGLLSPRPLIRTNQLKQSAFADTESTIA